MFKKIGLGILGLVKLDPVKYALYQVGKLIVIHGSKALAKSTKNSLDDKIVAKIEVALGTKKEGKKCK
jgi:hypothetical protein